MTRLIRRTAGKPSSRIDVVESWTDLAVDVNRFPRHTAECNIITIDTLCIPFPELTSNRLYAAARTRRLNPKKAILLATMKLTGVELQVMEDSERAMFDEFCATVDIRKEQENSRAMEDVQVKTRLEV